MIDNKIVRNSNIELLRIISIFVIVLSHVVGGGESLSGINEYLVIFQNSSVHAGVGVTCFIFISGYYGIRFSRKRLNKICSIIWMCSICSLFILFMSGNASLTECFKSIFPIITRKYWYASCYVFLLILSPWINEFTDNLEKDNFQKLLLACITLFYVLPTFFYFEIMNDKGKGFVHMVVCYMVGRYIAKYIDISNIKIKILWRDLLGIIAISFGGNIIATLVRGEISWPFSRECSITTLLIGILLCMIALHGTSESKKINAIAVYTFHVYLLNNALIIFISQYFCANENSMLYMFEQLLIAGAICCICVLIAIPLNMIAGLVAKVTNRIENICLKDMNLLVKNKYL